MHLLTLGMMMLFSPVYAVAALSNPSATVKVQVKVLEVPCHINGDSDVSVEFGTVLSNKLESVSKDIPLSITCDNTPNGNVNLEVKGNPTSFDATALATDVDDLGVVFYSVSNKLLKLNNAYNVSEISGTGENTGSFNIVGKLVKSSNGALSGGEFSASATLILITV